VHCGPASQPLPSRAAKLGTRIDRRTLRSARAHIVPAPALQSTHIQGWGWTDWTPPRCSPGPRESGARSRLGAPMSWKPIVCIMIV
jgi:hypothetical protein